MKKKISQLVILLLSTIYGSILPAAQDQVAVEASQSAQYLAVSVDNIVIDTLGLESASNKLANSIDSLARAIEKLSTDGAAMTVADREILLGAMKSVDQASIALAQLAIRIPQAAQKLTDQFPQVIKDARAPIADLSSGLKSASDGILAVTESLPQATENARDLVNSVLNSALIRVSIFAVILLVVFALTLIWITGYLYRTYLNPIARKLDALVGAPEHFANMSKHMQETSENLLALQNLTAMPSNNAAKTE